MQEKYFRTVDELGRIVLPVAIRNALGIDATDVLEVTERNGEIILTKS